MSDLFHVEESKSPRLQWMEWYSVATRQTGTESDELGDCRRWIAENPFSLGYGHTEDEAIVQLALKLGIKLWNEEGQP